MPYCKHGNGSRNCHLCAIERQTVALTERSQNCVLVEKDAQKWRELCLHCGLEPEEASASAIAKQLLKWIEICEWCGLGDVASDVGPVYVRLAIVAKRTTNASP